MKQIELASIIKQGYPKDKAYVHFGGDGAIDLLPVLASQIFKESYRKHGTSICLEVNYVGIALRWHPCDYQRVFRIFKMLAAMALEQKAKHMPFGFFLMGMEKFKPPRWKKVPKTGKANCKMASNN